MRLSKTSAQAALALAFLARDDSESFVQARQVADHLGIPTDSALKILQSLARGGLIVSQLGRNGGYRLEQPAHDITLLHIVELIDGPLDGRMPLRRVPDAVAQSLGALEAACADAVDRLREVLSTKSIAELAFATAEDDLDTVA